MNGVGEKPGRPGQDGPWYKVVLRELAAGRNVQIKGRGKSMEPLIPDGGTIQVAPAHPAANPEEIEIRDVVLVRMGKGKFLTHLVREIAAGKYLIGNNLGGTDGWVPAVAILGKMVRIGEEPGFPGATVEED
jgi:hypothetical protein